MVLEKGKQFEEERAGEKKGVNGTGGAKCGEMMKKIDGKQGEFTKFLAV